MPKWVVPPGAGSIHAKLYGTWRNFEMVVFNAVSGYSPEELKSKNEVKAMAGKHGWYVFDSEVVYSKSYPKGAREGKPIFRTSYARTTATANFLDFANEFAKRIGL